MIRTHNHECGFWGTLKAKHQLPAGDCDQMYDAMARIVMHYRDDMAEVVMHPEQEARAFLDSRFGRYLANDVMATTVSAIASSEHEKPTAGA